MLVDDWKIMLSIENQNAGSTYMHVNCKCVEYISMILEWVLQQIIGCVCVMFVCNNAVYCHSKNPTHMCAYDMTQSRGACKSTGN